MPRGLVICADAQRRKDLLELMEFDRKQTVPVTPYLTVEEACKHSTGTATEVGVIFLSFVERDTKQDRVNNMGQVCDYLTELGRVFTRAKVIVELANDWPPDAFEALKWGAYNVVALGTVACDIFYVIGNALTGKNAYPVLLSPDLLPEHRPCSHWGFMSMRFDPQDSSTNDYRFAIEPVTKLLRLDLARVDETPLSGGDFDLRKRLQDEIKQRRVLVAQVSTLTPNTMYEIGYADALGKPILWLRYTKSAGDNSSSDWTPDEDLSFTGDSDRPWKQVPAVLQGFIRLHYSTRTELAMRLFFGLGGSQNDLPAT